MYVDIIYFIRYILYIYIYEYVCVCAFDGCGITGICILYIVLQQCRHECLMAKMAV